ncbi:hypothetical protein EGW08_005589 [Elysia chlorotica]|uniref:Charged multivesicular body protein 4b n=1 Tax=Elysia chlorotica TaxID=188477 RepID=A0A433TYL2_ELYCH|nr:hypothetical protein EGW08_005589 [Elysia chlorotica]
MSLLKRLFRIGEGGKTPTAQEGIQRLRDVEEMLNKKSEFLEKKIEAQIRIAKENGTRNKRVALRALKTKRNFEKQLQQIDGSLSTIEYQREALESASANVEVFNVIRVASDALQGLQGQLDIDEVHKIMDEAAEQKELADDLSDLISNPENFGGQVFDEDDLLAELEELEQEELNEKLLDVGETAYNLPSIPTSEPAASVKNSKVRRKDDDEAVMDELAMWAS